MAIHQWTGTRVYEGDKFVAYNGATAPFSNFYRAPFQAPIVTSNSNQLVNFQSVEQYFAFNKAVLFNDRQTAQQILQTTSGRDLRILGRSVGQTAPNNGVRAFDDQEWQQYVNQVLATGIYEKFSQNQNLRQLLQRTNGKMLVEGSRDARYGAGHWSNEVNDSNYNDGQNIQGKMVMSVRDALNKKLSLNNFINQGGEGNMPQRNNQNQIRQNNQRARQTQLEQSDNTQYVMFPGKGHVAYNVSSQPQQSRYRVWRNQNVSAGSPVTVDEMMRALSPAIVRSTNRNTLKKLLTQMSSPVEANDNTQVNLISVRDSNNNYHDVSPSDVQTALTVLRVLNDYGLDYDIYPGRDNTIVARLNDNSRSFITLLDPEEPQRMGEVRTRDNVHWGTELTRLPYTTPDGQEHAIAQGYLSEKGPDGKLRHGALEQPVTLQHRNSTPSYRYNERRMNHWKLHASYRSNGVVTPQDVTISREMAMARYEGLDQHTKNRLAIGPMVNALGLDPSILSPQLRADAGVGKFETVNRLQDVSRNGYQGQVNLGTTPARINRVVWSQNSDGQEPRSGMVPASRLNPGKINLDLRSGIVVDNNMEGLGHNPVKDPNVMTNSDADTLIVNGYNTARRNFLAQLTSSDVSGVDDDLAHQQELFKRYLADSVPTEGMNLDTDDNADLSVKKRELEPLDIDSQKEVLKQFSDGIFDAKMIHDANDDSHLLSIDDSNLQQNRQKLLNSTNDPALRARRVRAFDNLARQFNARFGVAPVENPVVDNQHDMTGLTLDDYRNRYSNTLGRLSDDQKDAQLHQFDDDSYAIDQIFTNAFGDDLDLDRLRQLDFGQQRRLLDVGVTGDNHDELLNQFDAARDKLFNDAPLHDDLNVTQVIASSTVNSNDVDYEFKMAQAAGKSRYQDSLSGNNDQDTTNVMQRSVTYDPSTAKTVEQLLAEDKTGHEAELQQYVKDVQSGKKKFSWDPKENPEPSAFRADGSGLIRSESPNHFKARAMNLVKQRLVARGAKADDVDVKMDDQGIIHFRAQLPLYDATTHQVSTSGKDYQRDKDGNLMTGDGSKTVYVNRSKSNQPRMQMVEGSIGQVFAPGHDGLIRTNYRRFGNIDPKLNQQIFLPRMRAWYQLPRLDENGAFDMHKIAQEQKNGLGTNNRLRVQTYDMLFNRELAQNVDNLITTRNVGDVTDYNSTTEMSKLLHGEVLGNKVPDALLHEKPSPVRQAKLETQERAVKFADNIAQATKTTNVVSFAGQYQKTAQALRKGLQNQYSRTLKFEQGVAARYNRGQKISTGLMKSYQAARKQQAQMDKMIADPHWPDAETVQNVMQNPLSFNGLHSLGELAHEQDMYYFDDLATGQGPTLGPLRYLANGVQVEDSGRVKPNIFFTKNKEGQKVPVKHNGKYVGFESGTPITNLPFFNNAYRSSFDRVSVALGQAIKGHQMPEIYGIANMAISGWTTEDAMIVSKKFAQDHQFVDSKGNLRGLKIGDKISDQSGNKATIAMVVDPNMDLKEAKDKHILDVVSLFHDNPDLGVVMNGMSQLSRNNAATTHTMLYGKSSQPMKFTRYKEDENGKMVPDGTVQTNATINQARLIITDQTVDHKVTLYNQPGDKGRKSGGLNLFSDVAKGAPTVANYFRNYKNGVLDWRRNLLSMGLDLKPDGTFAMANYPDLIKNGQLKSVDYQLSDSAWQKLSQAYTSADYPQDLLVDKGSDGLPHLNYLVVGGKSRVKSIDNAPVFDGVDKHGNLSVNSQKFMNGMMKFLRQPNRSKITFGDDVTQGSDYYNAGRDFLNSLPDGGVVKLPKGVTLKAMYGDKDIKSNYLYVLPQAMRADQLGTNGMLMQSQMNRCYSEMGTRLAQYSQLRQETIRAKLANGDPKVQQEIDSYLVDKLGIQQTFEKITSESRDKAFGTANPKLSEFNTDVIAGHIKDSVTSQVSSNPNLPFDVIEVSPKIAKRLHFVQNKDDQVAHMIDKDGKSHPDWQYLHVHRDPIWREQGSLAFRVKINPEITNVRISPIIASLMDGDFDGDNLGLISMRGDKVQDELKNRCSVDQWMLDNNSVNNFKDASNLMNINAELVDNAVQTNNTYPVADQDGKVTNFKPFDHAKDKDGNVIPLVHDADNPDAPTDTKLVNQLVDLMGRMRDDVIPDAMKDEKGHFNAGIAKKALQDPDTTMNDSDVLNMMVDNAVKNDYEKGRDKDSGLITNHEAAVDARHDVEKLVLRARGYEPKLNPKTNEVDFGQHKVSNLVNDGVNYSNEDELKKSLGRYVSEGAKGHPENLAGLMDYMNEPGYKDVVNLGKSQMKDGKLDVKAYNQYHQTMNKLHDTILAVQKSTKEKSDITGVPGNAQKMFTDVLSRYGQKGLHAANALGQPGTQTVLSIKRDPVKAGEVAEVMQGPIAQLLDGQRPKQNEHRSFALMGAESQGRLGNDIIQVSERLTTLHNIKVPGTNKNMFDLKTDPKDYTDQQLAGIYKALDMHPTFKDDDEKKAFKDNFKEVLSSAKAPFVPIYDENGKQILDPKADENDPLKPEEFANAMQYCYNKIGMDASRYDFDLLAKALTDEDGMIASAKEATDERPDDQHQVSEASAPLMFRVKEKGVAPVENQVIVNAHKDASNSKVNVGKESIFGAEGSDWRKAYWGGRTNEQMHQLVDLTQSENAYAKQSEPAPEDSEEMKAQVAQDNLIAQTHSELEDNIRENRHQQEAASAAVKTEDSLNHLDKLVRQSLNNLNNGSVASAATSTASQVSHTPTEHTEQRSTRNAEKTTDAVNRKVQENQQRLQQRRRNRVQQETENDQATENDTNAKTNVRQQGASQARQQPDDFKAVDDVKTQISHGNYQSPFEVQVGSHTAPVKSINQYIACKYYEKAYRDGVRFKQSDHIVDHLKNPKSIDDLRNTLLKISDTSTAQLSESNSHPYKLMTKADNKKFFEQGFASQVKASKKLQKLYHVAPNKQEQQTQQVQETQNVNQQVQAGNEDNLTL